MEKERDRRVRTRDGSDLRGVRGCCCCRERMPIREEGLLVIC